MPTDIQIEKLIINKLTKAQYDAAQSAGNISDNELYFITDDEQASDVISEHDQSSDAHASLFDSLYDALSEKQNILNGSNGQLIGFDANGQAIAQDMPSEVTISDTAPTDENVKVWINPNEDNYGGYSADPDLVIGLNVANTKVCPDGASVPNRGYLNMNEGDVTIVSGSVSATAEKIRQGLPVRVLLNEVHFYWSNAWLKGIVEASHVQLMSQNAEYPNEGNLTLTATFFVSNYGGCSDCPTWVLISFVVATEEVSNYCAYRVGLEI